jgi:hypothetical protein
MTDLAAAIRSGAYDGTPYAPAELARTLADARREDLDAALRDHVRDALRSADTRRVGIALTHLDVTARAGAIVARALIDVAYDAVADDAARRIVSGTCGAR